MVHGILSDFPHDNFYSIPAVYYRWTTSFWIVCVRYLGTPKSGQSVK